MKELEFSNISGTIAIKDENIVWDSEDDKWTTRLELDFKYVSRHLYAIGLYDDKYEDILKGMLLNDEGFESIHNKMISVIRKNKIDKILDDNNDNDDNDE